LIQGTLKSEGTTTAASLVIQLRPLRPTHSSCFFLPWTRLHFLHCILFYLLYSSDWEMQSASRWGRLC